MSPTTEGRDCHVRRQSRILIPMNKVYRLIISAPDRTGLVSVSSQFIAEHNGSILEADHHTDKETGWFFMRYEIEASDMDLDLAGLREAFGKLAQSYQMNWQLNDAAHKKKVALLVSKASHCLADLLHRWHAQELFCDIACVISNHRDLEQMANWYNVPFFYVPIDKTNKAEGFAKMEAVLAEQQIDVVVLARYMQIMPKALCEQYAGRMINIHHSFLPSFIGAKPYHQAFARGVKLIGATCHYVTADLDEGPIIEQDVARVTHRENSADLVRLGRDVEKTVLARGLRYHLQDRVLLQGNKTVVL